MGQSLVTKRMNKVVLWELILNRPDVSQAIDAHLQADRLIIGLDLLFQP